MATLDEIEIPASAMEVKAWFQTRPDDTLVKEIQAFVKDTGQPYLWRGHTHTKPPSDALPVYLGEFDLPKSHQLPERRSPCPCCWPRHPKYSRNGKIAWFPEEGVIRLLGPACFRSLNPEGHDLALATLRREEQRRKDIAYLLANTSLVPKAILAVDRSIEIAKALDNLREQLQARLEMLRIRLWDQLRDGGQLKVRVTREELYQTKNGDLAKRKVDAFEPYARIEGYRLLDPHLKKLEPRLRTARKNLAAVSDVIDVTVVSVMDDSERSRIAGQLSRGFSQARDAIAEVEDVLQFLAVVSIATLRTWGALENCPTPIYIGREGANLLVGKSPTSRVRIDWDYALNLEVIRLPEISYVVLTEAA